jgi:hypothetical protein
MNSDSVNPRSMQEDASNHTFFNGSYRGQGTCAFRFGNRIGNAHLR